MLLKFFRKKKNMKRIMWALAVIIIPAFVIWGAGSAGRKREKGPDYAGKIFNKKISFDEYLDMWRVTRDHAIRTFGVNIPSEFIDQLAWNRIILLKEAEREKINVADTEVLEKIISMPIFQREGVFDKKLYKSMLADSAKGFEEKLRDDLRISKLTEKVTADITLSDEEIREEYRKKFEKIKASYIAIPFADFEKDVRYEESNLIDFYEKNKDLFRKPEQRNLKYIDILFSSFDKEVYIEDGEIERYFEEHISTYKKEGSDEMPVLDDEMKKKISEELSIQRKGSFAEELSYKVLDMALKEKDLDKVASSFALTARETGSFSQQDEIPGIGWSYEFTKKGFELRKEEISNVLIKTDKGFYIIQLKGKKPSYVPDFSEARDSVIDAYIKNQSIKLSEKKAMKIYMRIDSKLSPLTPPSPPRGEGKGEGAFEKTDLEIKQTDLITRDGYIPMLGPTRGFVEACISTKTGQVTNPLKMQNSWVIARPDEYEDIDEAKYIEEKEGFKEELLSRKKDSAFNAWFNKLLKEGNFVSYTRQEEGTYR